MQITKNKTFSKISLLIFGFCFFIFSAQNTHAATLISNCAELQAIPPSSNLDYELTNSFSCSGIANFDPIDSFKGTFDGNGYTISDLYINRVEDRVALFGSTSSPAPSFSNLKLENVDITGNQYTAGLMGHTHGATVKNVHVSGNISGWRYVGGIIGYARNDHISNKIINSSADINISITGDEAGGLIGSVYNEAHIINSYALGSVQAAGDEVGGLAGNQGSGSALYIYNSYASVTTRIGATNNNIGGLFGVGTAYFYNSYYDTDAKCYHTTNTLFTCPDSTETNQGGSDIARSSATLASESIAQTGVFDNWSSSVWTDTASFPTLNIPNLLTSNQIDQTDRGDFGKSEGGPGDGSENDPWLIEDCYDLQNIDPSNGWRSYLSNPSNSVSDHYKLANDIDCSETNPSGTVGDGSIWDSSVLDIENWNATFNPGFDPINSFAGTFDGNGHTISNLYINRVEDRAALFGSTSSPAPSFSNLKLENVDITGNQYTAGLMGHTHGATVKNVHVSGNISGWRYVGGIIGYARNDHISNKIINSSADINISITGDEAGGLIGSVYNEAHIINSYALGSVQAAGDEVGGLAGNQGSGSALYIYNSYASVTTRIGATNNNIGGLFGVGTAYFYNSYYDTDAKCYHTTNTLFTCPDSTETNQGGSDIARSSATLASESVASSQGLFSKWNSLIWSDSDGDFPTLDIESITLLDPKDYSALGDFGKSEGEPGDGTEEFPWLVEDCYDLQNIDPNNNFRSLLYNPGNTLDDYYLITNDIDCSTTNAHGPTGDADIWDTSVQDISDWPSITEFQIGFDPINGFTGVLDGAMNAISGIHIDRPNENNIGLFSNTSYSSTDDPTIIENIYLTDVDITGNEYTGGLIGNGGGTNLINIFVGGDITGADYVGGIAGALRYNGPQINTSFTKVTATGSSKVGGLFGYTDNVSIVNSYSSGTITATSNYAGGLTGDASSGNITNSYTNSKVTIETSPTVKYVGGLTGQLIGPNPIESYYNVDNECISQGVTVNCIDFARQNQSLKEVDQEEVTMTTDNIGQAEGLYEEWNDILWKRDEFNGGFPYLEWIDHIEPIVSSTTPSSGARTTTGLVQFCAWVEDPKGENVYAKFWIAGRTFTGHIVTSPGSSCYSTIQEPLVYAGDFGWYATPYNIADIYGDRSQTSTMTVDTGTYAECFTDSDCGSGYACRSNECEETGGGTVVIRNRCCGDKNGDCRDDCCGKKLCDDAPDDDEIIHPPEDPSCSTVINSITEGTITEEGTEFNVVWSANGSGPYTAYIQDSSGMKLDVESGYYSGGDHNTFIDLEEVLKYNYQEYADAWQEKLGTDDVNFDLNSDGIVDISDYGVFYHEWVKDASDKSFYVSLESRKCKKVRKWSLKNNIYMSQVSAYPRSKSISEPIRVILSGTPKIFYSTGGEYLPYTEQVLVNPGSVLIYYGIDEGGEKTTTNIEKYPKKIAITEKAKRYLFKFLNRGEKPQQIEKFLKTMVTNITFKIY